MKKNLRETFSHKIKRFREWLRDCNFYYLSCIFVMAQAVRFLHWQDSQQEALRVQPGVVAVYQHFAKFLLEDGFLSFFDAQSRISTSIDFISHPPGYSYLLAVIFYFAGESNAAIQFVSTFFDSLSAVLVFLIAKRLFNHKIAFLAGLLSAFAPQCSQNSVYLLPDTLAVFPILLATLFFILFVEKPKILYITLSGICIGVSCWLRANALLMPIFFMIATLVLVKERRVIFASILLTAFLMTISPITIRNAFIYKQFIPLSLGAGQTLLEGIADYDDEQRFGFSRLDVGIAKKEAEELNRPDYALSLFVPDGIKRDRMRIKQGWKVIRENPLWFKKVMILRAFSMLRLERVRLISQEIPISDQTETQKPKVQWNIAMSELAETGKELSSQANISVRDNVFYLTTDTSKRGEQFATPAFQLNNHKDYLVKIRLQITKGRVSIKVKGVDSQKTYTFTDVPFEENGSNEYPFQEIKLTFVSNLEEKKNLVISNDVSNFPNSQLAIEKIEVIELGESSNLWTSLFRFIVRNVQRLYLTAIILPLAILGLGVLIFRREKKIILILLVVPFNYFSFQSALHTEYRYVLAILHFMFILASFFTVESFGFLVKRTFGKEIKNYDENKI